MQQHLQRSPHALDRMAALLRRVLEKDRTGAPLPLPVVASGVRGSRFATAFGRMLQARFPVIVSCVADL